MKPARRPTRLTTGLLVAALALLALAPSAGASVTTRYPAIASFGPDGTSASSFGDVSSSYPLAFDQAGDRLYLFDRSGPTIYAFNTPSLTPVGGNFPLTVAAGNCCNTPIAVDNSGGASAGRIYYVAGDNKIYAYDSTGNPVGGAFPVVVAGAQLQGGAAVDSAGNLFVSDFPSSVIRKFSPAGSLLATIPAAQGPGLLGPASIAIDSNGDLFVSHQSSGLYKYTAAGGYTSATQIDALPQPRLALDTSTHRLYAAYGRNIANKASAFDAATGARLYDFAAGIPGAGLESIAVDEGTDQIYVGDIGNRKAYAFGPAQSFADATATPNPATAITDTSAQVSATITENSPLDTAWRLELSGDGGATWRAVGSGRTSGRAATIASTGPDTGTLTVRAGGGAFKLTFAARTTAPINYNASAAAVRSALEALSTIGAGNVTVSGGPGSASGATPYNLAFTGALAGTSVTQISTDPALLHHPPLTVTATVTGLDPNSDYRFRAVTNKGADASTEVASSQSTFRTVAPPPVITDLGAVNVADTSARLVATIDPRNTPTGYVFEYGLTPALGQQTAPINIGSGIAPITVSQLVTGLSKDTTYYFRVVATNLTGTTRSASQTFHTRTDPFPLPEGRAYEQVTPVDKNYSDIDASFSSYQRGLAAPSPDGNSAAFCPTGLFGDPAGQLNDLCSPYLSRRTPDGWKTTVFARYCGADPVSGDQGFLVAFLSPDFSRAFLRVPEFNGCALSPIDPAAPLPPSGMVSNFYREDFTTDPPSFDLLAPQFTESNTMQDFATLAPQGSDDFSHVVYRSRGNQTLDSPPPGSFLKIYDWHNGSLELVSKDPAGNPFTTGSDLPSMSFAGSKFWFPSSVSSNGERIYFQNEVFAGGGCAAACELYMREGATTTYHVSASECTGGCGSGARNEFILANPTGDKAFFSSLDRLTDVPGSGLYRWDRNAAPGSRLVLLNPDNEPSDGTAAGARHLIGASDDGNTVYFTTEGQIVSGAPTFPATLRFFTMSGLKLYRWRWNSGNPSIDYLGRYDELNGSKSNDINGDQQHRQVTPDGRFLLIYTKLAYDPAADRDADADAYRWDEAGGWTCVSCQLPGAPSGGNVHLDEGGFNQTLQLRSSEPRIAISDDGRRIFFGTPDALVPGDVNGEGGCPSYDGTPEEGKVLLICQDVYEWNDGALSLISTGTGDVPAWLVGSTPSGEDVFFYTRERLVGWDVDDGTDIYDARVGGGLPEPPAQPPACDLDAGGCEGPGTVAPNIPGAGSTAFDPGNPPMPQLRPCPKGKRKVIRRGKTRCVAKKKHHNRAAKHNWRAGR